jgi:hypothetical protein
VVSHESEKVGLATYKISGASCELVSINSTLPSSGVGTALIEAVRNIATKSGCKRLWLITTNDNMNALRFYQKRGFILVAVHKNALGLSRKLKPEIPIIGNDGIPLRDEIELEMILASGLGDRIGIVPMLEVDAAFNILAGILAVCMISRSAIQAPISEIESEELNVLQEADTVIL